MAAEPRAPTRLALRRWLYRDDNAVPPPVGEAELALIAASGYTAFPHCCADAPDRSEVELLARHEAEGVESQIAS